MNETQEWILRILENLHEKVDPEVRRTVLAGCGRGCLSRGLIEKAKKATAGARDDDEILERLSTIWGHLKRDGKGWSVTYDTCYCPVAKGLAGEGLPASFCDCSRGWILELVESVLERPIDVEILGTVQRGAEACRFRLRL